MQCDGEESWSRQPKFPCIISSEFRYQTSQFPCKKSSHRSSPDKVRFSYMSVGQTETYLLIIIIEIKLSNWFVFFWNRTREYLRGLFVPLWIINHEMEHIFCIYYSSEDVGETCMGHIIVTLSLWSFHFSSLFWCLLL